MNDWQEIFDALSEPFPTEVIDWRIGSTTQDKTKGMALAYIDARVVQDRLDTVCGPGNWQANYTATGPESIVCNIGIRIEDGDWVWKANGAGKTDFEAEKGMYSDAFKRAAVMFGVGRYLYDMPSPWVEVENNGKKISEAGMKKLTAAHDDFCNKANWGPRSGIQVYRLLKKVALEFVSDAAMAQEFKDKNKGEIALLPVAMRRHLFTVLDRVGATQQEAA